MDDQAQKQASAELQAQEANTYTVREEDLHVMPEQYLPSRLKAPVQTDSTKKFVFLIGFLALFLALIIGGLLVYLKYQAGNPSVQVNVNSGINQNQPVNVPETPVVEEPLSTPEARDIQRLTDIGILQEVLTTYYQQRGVYPQVLSGLPVELLPAEPQDPSTSTAYGYVTVDNSTNYRLTFTLEQGGIYRTETLTSGTHEVNASGLIDPAQPDATATSTPPLIEDPTAAAAMAQDTDKDGLTLAEEQSFRTKPDQADTDGDGFKDGEELKNLYSPINGSGAMLNVSGLIKVYTNGEWLYKVWYPQDWIERSLSAVNDQEIIFTSPQSDNITISVESNSLNDDIETWFLARNLGVSKNSLRIEQVAGMKAIRSADGLSIYFTDSEVIFSVVYQVAATGPVKYPNVLFLMLKTFSLQNP